MEDWVVELRLGDGNVEVIEVGKELADRISQAIAKGEIAVRGSDSQGRAVYINFRKYASAVVRPKYASF